MKDKIIAILIAFNIIQLPIWEFENIAQPILIVFTISFIFPWVFKLWLEEFKDMKKPHVREHNGADD